MASGIQPDVQYELWNYDTQRRVRAATAEETAESREAQRWDDGRGLIRVRIGSEWVPCYVVDRSRWNNRPA
jgi:hypothetical protein